MERVKRRWWTWAVSLIAATVIVGAVLSGAFQLAVLAVPSYREDLASWVGDVAGRPVQIGGISLSWRGFTPRFDLSGITLYSEEGDEELRVERLSLGFAWSRLLRGEWVPSRLELSGLRVSLSVDDEGGLHIAGLGTAADASTVPQGGRWLDDVERFHEVVLENCELRVQHPALGEAAIHVRLEAAELTKTTGGYALGADLRLPPDRGGAVTLEAELHGVAAQWRQLKGDFELSIEELQPQGWLRPWLLPGTQILAAGLGGRIDGEIGSGRVQRVRAEFASGGLVLARAGVLSSARETSLVVDYLRDPRGWRVDIGDLSFDRSLLLRGTLRHDLLDDTAAWDFDADQLELTRLAPWVGVWRDGPAWLQALGSSRGEVEGLVLRYRHDADTPRYALRARLREIELRPNRHFGVRGVNGELSADENGGRVQLTDVPLALELPGVLEQDIAFDTMSADLRWRRSAEGWRVGSDSFAARLASIALQGKAELLLPEDQASPQLDLTATLSAGDVRDAQAYLPRFWPAPLQQWLRNAIVAARVAHGDLRIRGPVDDFPYHRRRSGEWSLELEVADAEFNYAPDWPPLRDARAGLVFRGNGLQVRGAHARLLDSRVSEASARIDDFGERLLKIDAQVDGSLPQHYAVLRDSPLREPLRVLLEDTEASGDARVGLRLQIPLQSIDDTRVDGEVALTGSTLRYRSLEQPVEQLRGTLGFNRDGVTAEALQATFVGVPLALRIDAEEGSFGVIRGDFSFAPQADGSGLSQFVPAVLRDAMQGASAWQFELPLRRSDSALALRSDLIGTTLPLPPPLAKTASESVPLQLRLGSDEQAPLRIAMNLADRLALDMALERAASTQGWQISGLHARLGAEQVPAAVAGRSLIDGSVAELDLAPWIALAARSASASSGSAAATDIGAAAILAADPAVVASGLGEVRIDTADISAGRVLWDRQVLPATRLQYRALNDGWSVDLSGEGAVGALRWLRADGGRLEGRLQHLRLETLLPPQPSPEIDDADAAPIDPARWPVLDLVCEDLAIGEAQLGRAVLTTRRVMDGQALSKLQLSGGEAELTADGEWLRRGGASSASLRFDLTTSGIDKLLVGLGYAPNIEARDGHASTELRWAPAPDGLRWELATGNIDLSFGEGQLRAVKPGASRALALLNFYALPRRLTLNFDDVVGEGLAFDAVNGRFVLADGVATTTDLRVDGSSLKMDIRGSVGLLARDYDQRVTVYPDVSSGVTLGAVLLGGPAVGALVLLAQELLEKPLEQVTQFSYRISGPWDNPRVERVDGATEPPG